MDGRALLIFDGDCAFCTQSVDFGLRRFDAWPATLPFQNLSDDELQDLGLNRLQVSEQVWLCLPGEPPLGGARAVTAILGLQPQLGWRLVSGLLRLPLMNCATAATYRWVARNRHRLPGRKPSCELTEVRS